MSMTFLPAARSRCFALATMLFGLIEPTTVQAVESATSFYVIGLHGPLAAIAPPPGVYFQNDVLIYGASASASQELPFTGRVTAGIKADVYVDIPTLLWQTRWRVAGGSIGVTVSQPFGNEYVAGHVIAGPLEGSLSGSRTEAGDLAIGLPVSWSKGRFNWSVTPSLNVPSGGYDTEGLANIALHRWAGDMSGAVTWLDRKTGFEASGIAGVTLNGTNPATDYRTGTEVHLEAALSQYLSPIFSVGILGGYLQQVTADSGRGDLLGDFKGRAWAAGGTASYQLAVYKTPVQLRLKVLKEFAVQNRLSGTSGILSVGISF